VTDTGPGPGTQRDDEVTVTDMLLSIVDVASERVLNRPIRPRVRVSAAGLLRGELDVAKIEIPAFAASGLVVDRFVVRAERVRITPGLPPHLKAGPLGLKAVVGQENLDRWTRAGHLPVRLELRPDAVVVTTGLAGFKVTQLDVDLAVHGSFVQLRPRRVTMLGMPAPLVRFLRGYLPLPPLPRGARLDRVDHGDGELCVTFVIDEVDETITPDIARRLASFLRMPGLR
jgi:hypothetical protein